MDLGIAGRTAIVCASSRGLGRACATSLARAGCHVIINGRDATVLNATADAIRAETGGKVTPVVADVGDGRGAVGIVRRGAAAGHPRQQQCRPARPRFPGIDTGTDRRGPLRQHDRGDRAHSEGDRSDGGPEVRPHRQHHFRIGQNAAGRSRSVVRRESRSDCFPGRRGADGRSVERHHQLSAAWSFRHRAPLRLSRSDGEEERNQQGAGDSRPERRRSRPSGSASLPNLAMRALISVRRRRASSPDRAC